MVGAAAGGVRGLVVELLGLGGGDRGSVDRVVAVLGDEKRCLFLIFRTSFICFLVLRELWSRSIV